MKKPIYLLLLILVIALNIFCYNAESNVLFHVFQFLIEISSLVVFFYVLLNLEKSTNTKWIQIMIFFIFVSIFRWWKEPFVITKFLSNYAHDFYSQYGKYVLVFLILIGGGIIIKKLDLTNKSSL